MAHALAKLLTYLGLDSSAAAQANTALGLALPLLLERPDAQAHSLAWQMDRLNAALKAQQLEFAFDRFGQLGGFLLWATVSAEISQRMLRYGPDAVMPNELQSGSETWALEFCAKNGELPQVLALLRDCWLAQVPQLTYSRAKGGRRIAKRVSRSDPLSFFSRPQPAMPQDWSYLSTHDGEGLNHSAKGTLMSALELGQTLSFLRRCSTFAELPLPLALARVRAPLSLCQQKVYRDRAGTICGYLAWAWVDADLLHGGLPEPHQLAPYQWNEGVHWVVCDAYASAAGSEAVLADMEQHLFPTEARWARQSKAQLESSLPARPLVPLAVTEALTQAQALGVVDLLQFAQSEALEPA